MRFNRKIFFKEFKNNLLNGRALSQATVEALDDLLNQIERDTYLKSTYNLAYILATAWHETAFTLRPIKERGGKTYFINNYWKKVRVRNQLGNKSEYDAWARSGRGFVQLTGLGNDIKMTAELRRNYRWLVDDFEKRTGQAFDLVKHPEQALDFQIAYAVIVVGMSKGIFTGKKMSDYISNTKHGFDNYKEARRVVNGVDKAAQIANYAMEFEKVIRLSVTDEKPAPITSRELVAVEEEQTIQEPANDQGQLEQPTNDGYPNEPKPGEAVPDAPAQEGQPVAGGRPTDESVEVVVEEAKKPTGLNAWVATVRGWWVSLGIGGAGVGTLFSGAVTNPLLIKVIIGVVVFAIVAAAIGWVIYMVVRAIHVRSREKEAFELARLEMAIKADPTKYNVKAVVQHETSEPKSFLRGFIG